MASLQRGDPSAFPLLYHRYEKRLFNFLLRYTGNTARAEEIFQETFLRLYRARRSYRPPARFRTWLYTIARNLCRDLKKARRRELQVSGDPSLEISDPTETPLTLLLSGEREQKIRHAIQKLPDSHRAILILSRYEGLRYAEIAAILQMTPEAVKMAASRALQLFQEELGDE